ncbi:MAG: hypothetical protein WA609_18920 [Terriglobales bacterium]
MKAFSKAPKSNAVFVAALAVMMLAGSISAFAVPSGQVARIYNAVTFTGQCCYLWNETVQVTEPAKLVPVIVTWSADVLVNDEFLVGLSLNGSACVAYGSREIAFFRLIENSAVNATHQWIVFPSDGLVKGTNTFALCGGGAKSASDSISFGLSTLVVQISK